MVARPTTGRRRAGGDTGSWGGAFSRFARARRALAGSVLLGFVSAGIVPPAPSYDPWSWLLWGRELIGADLSTAEGPVFKPLTVAACAVLTATFGAMAPWIWVTVARIGAFVAICLAFRLGRRLASGRLSAGVLAAVGVALTGAYLDDASSGMSEGLLLALALAALDAALADQPRRALVCLVACALLRVETWPFLLLAAVISWRRLAALERTLLVVAAGVIPAAWLVPELVGSGHLLRAATRARTPNAGQPALAAFPALASVRTAVTLPLVPVWGGVVLLVAFAQRSRRTTDTDLTALIPAALGGAWIAIIAVMCQLGFSGEPRYALPGAALIAISGAVGLSRAGARSPLPVAVIGALVIAAAAVPRLSDLPEIRRAQAHQWSLQADLPDAIAAAGGRDIILRCGQPFVGPLRGPLLAYHLHVHKHVVEPDLPPTAPGFVFRSKLTTRDAEAPAAPDIFRVRAEHGEWKVLAAC